MTHKDNAKYQRNHYYRNKQYYYDKNKVRQAKIEAFMKDFKRDIKCTECNENHPACMEFHHIDPSKKEGNISHVSRRGWGIERIKREIDKCIILCSNCHRKLHYNLKGE